MLERIKFLCISFSILIFYVSLSFSDIILVPHILNVTQNGQNITVLLSSTHNYSIVNIQMDNINIMQPNECLTYLNDTAIEVIIPCKFYRQKFSIYWGGIKAAEKYLDMKPAVLNGTNVPVKGGVGYLNGCFFDNWKGNITLLKPDGQSLCSNLGVKSQNSIYCWFEPGVGSNIPYSQTDIDGKTIVWSSTFNYQAPNIESVYLENNNKTVVIDGSGFSEPLRSNVTINNVLCSNFSILDYKLIECHLESNSHVNSINEITVDIYIANQFTKYKGDLYQHVSNSNRILPTSFIQIFIYIFIFTIYKLLI